MAPGLKRWISFGGTVAFLAYLSLELVPEERAQTAGPDVRSVERYETERIARQIAAHGKLLQHMRVADSLASLVEAARAAGEPLVVGIPAAVADQAELVQARVGQELARLGVERPRAVLGLFLVDGSAGRHTTPVEVYPGRLRDVGIYTGRTAGGGEPYCFLAYAIAPDRPAAPRYWLARVKRPDATLLGPCALYGRHGAPGPAIHRWFEAGGLSAALTTSRPSASSFAGSGARRPERWIRRRIQNSITPVSFTASRCLAGQADACREALLNEQIFFARLHADVIERTPLVSMLQLDPRGDWKVGFGDDWRESLLHDLEHEFGHERFGRFWRSDQSLETAFAGAFGVTLDAWVMRWAQARLGVESAGPRLPADTLLLSLLTLALLAGAAVAVGRARQVG